MSTDTHQLLVTTLLHHGQARLSEIWGVDKSEVSRRINNERGIKLSDLAAAIDALGIRLVPPSQQVETIDRDMLRAIKVLARKGLDDEEEKNE